MEPMETNLQALTDLLDTPGARELIDMLRWRRPAGCKTERKFIEQYLEPLGFERDGYGNLIKDVGDATPSVIFCAHTDTVHKEGGKQELALTPHGMIRIGANERQSNCLGADDTTGVWICRQMILAQVPGRYILFRGEERGCLGSSWLMKNFRDPLDDISAAIEFDRRGYTDVITHQMSGRTASTQFAWSIAKQLGDKYEPDDTGLYTDTNELASYVPECTNLSVGYFMQHSTNEHQDLAFALSLRDKMLAFDASKLVIARDPHTFDDDDWKQSSWSSYLKADNEPVYSKSGRSAFLDDVATLASRGTSLDDILEVVRRYPEYVADLLEQQGYDADSLVDAIFPG